LLDLRGSRNLNNWVFGTPIDSSFQQIKSTTNIKTQKPYNTRISL
jgi:hypothetical protein